MGELRERIAQLSPAKQRLLQEKLQRKLQEKQQAEGAAAAGGLGPSPLRAAGNRFPCSFSQQRLWFLHQLEPASAAYNVPSALRLRGRLVPRHLLAALAGVVARHEVLRTTFEAGPEGPRQVVQPPAAVALPVVDLAGLAAPGGVAALAALLGAEARRPFDLARGPLLRTLLLRLGDGDHALALSLHHIVSDAWSRGILVQEVAVLYSAHSSGLAGLEPGPLPALPIQYADFADWQRRWLTGEVLAAQVEHWRRRLAGVPPVLTLPTDRPRPAVQSARGALRPFVVPARVAQPLEALALAERTTLFVVLLTAFQAFLGRLAGQDDVTVGTPLAGRRQRATEGLIGFFINTLVMRADLAGDPPLRQLLASNRERVLDDQGHQDVPFERLVDELGVPRTLDHPPLFQVMLALQNAPRAEARVAGLAIESLAAETGSAKFDLTLALAGSADPAGGNGLAGAIEYCTDLFDATTIDRWAGELGRLLAGVAGDPDQRLGELPLLSPAERHQLLAEINPGGATFPHGGSLEARFEAVAAARPEAIAVVAEGEALSYAALDGLAARWAARLRQAGVGPEVRVGLCLERSLPMLVGVLAILKAGGAYLPLDPAYPDERLRFLVADARPPVLLTQASLRQALAARLAGLAGLDVLALDEPLSDLAPAPPLSDRVALGERLAYVIYTSGSTGRPKGVGVSHANVLRLFGAADERFDFGPADVWTLFHSHAFDFSVWEIWGALLYGGRLVVVPYWVSRNPAAFAQLLAAERVTVLNQTPSAFRGLIAAEAAELPPGALALSEVIFGGEALDLPSLRPWFNRHGDRRPRLVNMYGITETTVHVTWRPIGLADLAGAAASVIGAALADLSLFVLDPNRQPAPLGVPGELCVGGAGLARGYLGRPALTAQRFVPALAGAAGGRLYRSGDLARALPNGDLEYLGRIDHQVKVRGFRIELGEIEAALGEHPAVAAAVVLARDGAGGEKRLVAYLVGARDAALPALGPLREFLRERLPEHMLPAAYVPLDALPLTEHGKTDRAALPLPEEGRSTLAGAFEPPESPAEVALAGVWSEVLGVDRVGVGDNFFALGGDSILSIRVRALATERGLAFELQDLFRFQTLGELARAARAVAPAAGADEAGTAPLAPFALLTPAERAELGEEIEDAYPLSFLQLGMLFHSQGEGRVVPYHNVGSFRFRGRLAAAALERALAALAVRHPVLRTSFDLRRAGEPLQRVHRAVTIPLTVEDLRALPAGERAARVASRFEAEKRRRFDVATPPLLRFWAFALDDASFELGVTEHHAIVDGWSYASLLAELVALYLAEAAGGTAPPLAPPPRAHFRDFVVAERATLDAPASRDFWQGVLADHPFPRLPRWPRPATAAPAEHRPGERSAIELPAGSQAALAALAEGLGVPVKSVLLAVHLRVLATLYGSPDVTTGLVTNGRPEVPDGERVLGLFLNTVPLRLRLAAGSWGELVRAVFAAETALLPHRRYPLAELQRRFGAGQRLFEVNFNYVHFHVLEAARGVEVVGGRSFAETSFPLTTQCSWNAAGTALQIELHWDPQELTAAQVQGIAQLYEAGFTSLLAGGLQASVVLPLADAEAHRLRHEWGPAAALEGGEGPARDLAERWPGRWASQEAPASLALEAPGRRLSFGELGREVAALAARLRHHGAGPDTRVALFFERSAEAVIALLAVLEAGAAYVPLEPAHPAERLAFQLADCGATLLLSRDALRDRLPPVLPAGLAVLELGAELAAGKGVAEAAPPPEVHPAQLAYVLYTSGSTGQPKGVMVSRGALAHYLAASRHAYRAAAGTGAPVHSPLGFDLTVTSLLTPLAAGRPVLVLPPGEAIEALAASLAVRRDLTLVKLTPSHLEALAALLPAGELAGRARALVIGGEVLTAEAVAPWRRHAQGTRLLNEYGPTETVVGCALYEVGEGDAASGPLPIGRPLPRIRLHVVGWDGRLALAGVPGELWIGGAGVSRGYLGRPALTAERFVPDPWSGEAGARLYRSGDRARHLPDGNLEVLGRLDEQLKVRGYRIEPGEIEAVLRAQPAVREAVVVARPGPGGDRRLVAYVVPVSPEVGTELAADLRRAAARALPEHMVPAAVVPLAALPLTANGKLDRARLPEPEAPPARERELKPPASELEATLAELFAELLAVAPIDRDDDFFALGGHSLLAVRLVGRIERATGQRLSLADLAAEPTVAGLARRLSTVAAGAAPGPLLVELAAGEGPPLFLVHPVGGSVVCYLPLARGGELARPVLALASPLPGQLPAASFPEPRSVESMAAAYRRAIVAAAPAGPYHLAGWSLGGVVAFEIARQLSAEGREVGLLALLDVAPPPAGGEPEEPRHELARFAADLAALAGLAVPAGLDPATMPATLADLLALDGVRAALPPELGLAQLEELFATFRANRCALAAYRPGPYSGALLRVETTATAAACVAADGSSLLAGWDALAAGGAEVVRLAGDHYSLLRPPCVGELGRLLAARLAGA